MAFTPVTGTWKEAAVWHFFDEIRDEEGYELDPVALYNRIQATQYEVMTEVVDSPGLVRSAAFERVDPAVIAIMMARLARAFMDAKEKLFTERFFASLSEVNAVMREVAKQYVAPHPDLLVVDDFQESPVH